MNLFDYLANERDHRARTLARLTHSVGGVRNVLLAVAALTAGIVGWVYVARFFKETRTEQSGHLWWKDATTTDIPLETRLVYLFIGIGLLIIAALCVVIPVRLANRRASLKKYLAILTGVESLKIQQIADITGSSKPRVFQDIQKMVDGGMIDDFFIDYQAEQVVSKKYVPKSSHKTVVTCSRCGGNNELIVGITRNCSFCGEPLNLSVS